MTTMLFAAGRKRIAVLAVVFALLAAAAAALYWGEARRAPRPAVASRTEGPTARRARPRQRKFKILHVMSYHSPWMWTDTQFGGFREALKGVDVEYKVFQMDTKRKSSEQWKANVGIEARNLIETWDPDLVFTGDDNAQEYVAKHYVNKDIPFVFCTVNADPEDYGFVGSRNITGVLERELFVQSVRLLRQIVPTVRKIAIITDSGEMWDRVMRRMKQSESQLGDVEIVSYDVLETFEQYKQKVKGYEGRVDALGMLGIFEFKDANGVNVPYQDVSRWTAENSALPDFTYWQDRVGFGTLCAVTVSGFAQGQEAGRIARGILVDGRSPSSYPMKPTVKGQPFINLARARKLNLNPKSSVLLTARVIKKFSWNKE